MNFPGEGLQGAVVDIRSRSPVARNCLQQQPELDGQLPPQAGGLECVILIDGRYAATYRFRDTPRSDGASFVSHLGTRHAIHRTMLVSGDRESEVRYLAEQVGIGDVYCQPKPRTETRTSYNAETAKANTILSVMGSTMPRL